MRERVIGGVCSVTVEDFYQFYFLAIVGDTTGHRHEANLFVDLPYKMVSQIWVLVVDKRGVI